MLAYRRLGQGSGQLNIRYLLTGSISPLLIGKIPLQVSAHGATWALTINSASVSQAIDRLGGVGYISKVIITRFDIGQRLPTEVDSHPR